MGYLGRSLDQVGEALSRAAKAVAEDGLRAGGHSLKRTFKNAEMGVSINRLVRENYITKGMGKQLKDAGYRQLTNQNFREAINGLTGVSNYKKALILGEIGQARGPMRTTPLAKGILGGLGVYAAFDVGGRVVGPGNFWTARDGRFDIAGIPFF